MKTNSNRFICFSYQRLGVLALVLVLALSGCAQVGKLKRQTKNMVRSVKTADRELVKKIALLPFLNNTHINQSGIEGYFQSRFVEQAAAICPDLFLLTPDKPGYPDLLLHLPKRESGRFDNMALAVFSRRAGLNATVQASISEIRPTREAKGILWFRKVPTIIHLGIGFEAYDPLTGAKIMDKTYFQQVEVEPREAEAVLKGEVKGPGPLKEALEKASETLAEALCDGMAATRWNGFIVSEPGTPITLSAGKNSGISAGMEFEVRRGSEITKGAGDQRFFVPGKIIGHVKVEKVAEDSAVCQLVSGEIEKGAFVQPK